MADIHDVTTWIVLLVEDDTDNIVLAQQVLSYHGAEVHIAEDGCKGLEVLKTVKPTVILVDLSMPRMDGWEMVRTMRANPETADIPVIAVTAHAMQESKERALASGFDGYITKPYLISTFVDEVREWLEKLDPQRRNR
jgi:two-component system cell cycle response regulator DivK